MEATQEPKHNSESVSDVSSHNSYEKECDCDAVIQTIKEQVNDETDVHQPDEGFKTENKPLKTIKRGHTMMKKDLIEADAGGANEFFECKICSNFLFHPVECSDCKKNFCKACYDKYVDAVRVQSSRVLCPACRAEPFNVTNGHPFLLSQLQRLRFKCVNASTGCTATSTYAEVEDHRKNCEFIEVICQNFGCGAKVLRKDFQQHDQTCEHKAIHCEKCDGILKKEGGTHDCFEVLRSRTANLERLVSQLQSKVSIGEKPSGYIERTMMDLPKLQAIRFDNRLGEVQTIKQKIEVPNGAKGMIVRYALTDVNVRRLFRQIVMSQSGVSNESQVDISNFFYIGPYPLPSFGIASEVMVPWNSQLNPEITVTVTLPPQPKPASGWFTKEALAQVKLYEHDDYLNSIAYASIQIVGFIY